MGEMRVRGRGPEHAPPPVRTHLGQGGWDGAVQSGEAAGKAWRELTAHQAAVRPRPPSPALVPGFSPADTNVASSYS